MMKLTSDNFSLGFVLFILTLVFFTVLDSTAKYLVVQGYPVYQIVFVRYAVHFVMMLLLIVPRQGLDILKCSNPYWVILRSLLLVGMTLFNFWALMYISLATTAAIMMVIPILICVLSVIFLHETIGIHRWTAVAIGFVGVMVIIRPFGIGFHWAMLLSLGMVLCSAGFNIITRLIAGKVDPMTLQFYGAIVALIVLLPLQFQGWEMPSTDLHWLLFLSLGFLGWSGHQLLIWAHHYAEASALAPIGYSQFIMMTFSSWLLFNDIPDLMTFIGAGIVLCSGLYIWYRETKKGKSKLKVIPEA